jgi:tellurite resistance protein
MGNAMQNDSPHEALIHLMIVTAAADGDLTNAELRRIGELVRGLPAFEGFDDGRLPAIAGDCQKILQRDDGLAEILDRVRTAVPERAHDTAYALAVEVAAADLHVEQEELRVLQMLRDRLGLDKLTAAAIESSARARYRRL